MTPTKLKYLENFTLLEGEAKVIDILKENDRDAIILDETIFYPQGGGRLRIFLKSGISPFAK